MKVLGAGIKPYESIGKDDNEEQLFTSKMIQKVQPPHQHASFVNSTGSPQVLGSKESKESVQTSGGPTRQDPVS